MGIASDGSLIEKGRLLDVCGGASPGLGLEPGSVEEEEVKKGMGTCDVRMDMDVEKCAEGGVDDLDGEGIDKNRVKSRRKRGDRDRDNKGKSKASWGSFLVWVDPVNPGTLPFTHSMSSFQLTLKYREQHDKRIISSCRSV